MHLLRSSTWFKHRVIFSKYTWICYMVFIVISAMLPISQAAPAAQEYQIKAVFLFNFVNFITWPDKSFKQDSEPFRICILGDDPFGMVLDVTVEKHLVEGRALKIIRLKEIVAGRICQILFISELEPSRQKDILKIIRNLNLPILTVGDTDDFIQAGGMIKFFSRNNKIRLGINPDALEAVGLKANANLLNLSEIERLRTQ
jgi:YfiR/HmsC-like